MKETQFVTPIDHAVSEFRVSMTRKVVSRRNQWLMHVDDLIAKMTTQWRLGGVGN
jgi:hypothetical protein